jgi:hypothetical protein
MKLKYSIYQYDWFITSELFHLINNPNMFIKLYSNEINIYKK